MNVRQFCLNFFETALFKQLTAITFATCLSSVITTSAQAGVVDLTVFGETNFATSENAFGLDSGDQISLKATFDHSVLSGSGFESISFAQGTGNNLSLFLGDLTFTSSNSLGFGLGFPTISFFDGVFSGIDYLAFSSLSGSPSLLYTNDTNWLALNLDPTSNSLQGAAGDFDASTQNISAADIPEPGPLALAAIGMVGAWIAARRRKTLI